MATDTSTAAVKSDLDALPDNNLLAVLRGSRYRYLGADAAGRHHHYDRAERVVYVLGEPAHRYVPDHGEICFVLVGEPEHTQALEDRPIEDWLAYVDADVGWGERYESIVSKAFGIVSRVMGE
ncbi:MAG: hypothetical protein ACLFR6_06345 [Salinarchaeum sp.]